MSLVHLIPPAGRRKAWTPVIVNHDGIHRKLWSHRDEVTARRIGERVERLVWAKSNGDPPPTGLNYWLTNLKPKQWQRLVNLGLVDDRRLQASKPITEHIDAYEKAVASRKNNGTEHAKRQAANVRRVLTALNVVSYDDIRQDDVMVTVKGWNVKDATRRHYLVAVTDFCGWMVRQKRASVNPMENTPMPRLGVDEAIRRRPLTVAEFQTLAKVLEKGGRTLHLRIKGGTWTGKDRRMLYWLAVCSGFRQAELASLRRHHLHLDANPPYIEIEAKDAKNKTAATVPIPHELAGELGRYVRTLAPADRVFRLPVQRHSVIKVFREDLKLAGIAEENDAGERVDFHALRTTAICWWLDHYNLSPKRVQILARLKTLSLVERYSKRLRLASDVRWLDSAPTMKPLKARRQA